MYCKYRVSGSTKTRFKRNRIKITKSRIIKLLNFLGVLQLGRFSYIYRQFALRFFTREELWYELIVLCYTFKVLRFFDQLTHFVSAYTPCHYIAQTHYCILLFRPFTRPDLCRYLFEPLNRVMPSWTSSTSASIYLHLICSPDTPFPRPDG